MGTTTRYSVSGWLSSSLTYTSIILCILLIWAPLAIIVRFFLCKIDVDIDAYGEKLLSSLLSSSLLLASLSPSSSLSPTKGAASPSQLEVALTQMVGKLLIVFRLTCIIIRSSESESKSKSRSNVASIVKNDGSSISSRSRSSISSSSDIISEDTERKGNITRFLTSQSCLGLSFVLIRFIQASSSNTAVGYSPALAID